MSKQKISSLAKIGYIEKLPIGADINDYEKIQIKTNGTNKKTTLYRSLKDRPKQDETTNFIRSWEVFNSHLL